MERLIATAGLDLSSGTRSGARVPDLVPGPGVVTFRRGIAKPADCDCVRTWGTSPDGWIPSCGGEKKAKDWWQALVAQEVATLRGSRFDCVESRSSAATSPRLCSPSLS